MTQEQLRRRSRWRHLRPEAQNGKLRGLSERSLSSTERRAQGWPQADAQRLLWVFHHTPSTPTSRRPTYTNWATCCDDPHPQRRRVGANRFDERVAAVAVRINEAGQHQLAPTVDHLGGLVLCRDLGGRADRHDPPAVD